MQRLCGIKLGWLACAWAIGGAALAQDPPSAPSSFCEDHPEFSQWDFWVGEWQVLSNDEERKPLGTNVVSKHYANCLIKETWVDSKGGGGFSVNYYNPVRRHWRQVWISNGYSIDYAGGLDQAGRMVLEGGIDYYGPNSSNRFRGTWTPEANGDVIQRFEIYDPSKDAWALWFEGRYVRQ